MWRIALTTPTQCGDLDSDYTHVQIMSANHNRKQSTLDIRPALGYMSAGNFVEGVYSKEPPVTIRNHPELETPTTEYDDFVGAGKGDAAVLINDSWDKKLLQHMLDEGIYVGSLSTT